MNVLVAIWGFIKRHAVAVVSAVAGFLFSRWFYRTKPAVSTTQSQTDHSIGALDQKAKDEQQAANDVPKAVWPTGDKNAVIIELRKDGVLE